MAKLSILSKDDVPEQPYPGRWRSSGVRSARQLSPDGYSLGLVLADIDAGGTVAWEGPHGDEGVYVLSGEVDVDGRRCPAGGAVIVESGVDATMTAVAPTTVIHCAPATADPPSEGLYGPPDADGHAVHVVGPGGWFESGQREGVRATWFADATCPTCRIQLFRVEHPPGFAGNFHSHSQDEIIFVLDGIVSLGPRGYGPGTALNIPADVTYRVSYPEGATFVNFRRDASEQTYGRDGPPVLEGAIARGGRLVEDFR